MFDGSMVFFDGRGYDMKTLNMPRQESIGFMFFIAIFQEQVTLKGVSRNWKARLPITLHLLVYTGHPTTPPDSVRIGPGMALTGC